MGFYFPEVSDIYEEALADFRPCEGYDRYFVNPDGDVVYINKRGTLKSVSWHSGTGKAYKYVTVLMKHSDADERANRVHVYGLIARAFGKRRAREWRLSSESQFLKCQTRSSSKHSASGT